MLSLGEHLERLDDLLHEEAGDGLVRVGRGLHVLGDKVPRVGHRAAVRLLCGPEHFGRDLGQALAANGFPMNDSGGRVDIFWWISNRGFWG